MEKKKMERDGPLNSYYSRVKSPLTDPAQARVRKFLFIFHSNFDIYKYYWSKLLSIDFLLFSNFLTPGIFIFRFLNNSDPSRSRSWFYAARCLE